MPFIWVWTRPALFTFYYDGIFLATCYLWSLNKWTNYHFYQHRHRPTCWGNVCQWLGVMQGGRWRCYCDQQLDNRYGCESVTGVAESWHGTYLSWCHNITSQQQLRQGQTERFSALLNCSNNRRAKLNWWSDLNNKRQIIKNIWKIFIDLTSSFLAAHSFSTYQPDQLYP